MLQRAGIDAVIGAWRSDAFDPFLRRTTSTGEHASAQFARMPPSLVRRAETSGTVAKPRRVYLCMKPVLGNDRVRS